MDKQLQREIRITAWAYEWYWSQVVAEFGKDENRWAYRSIPKIHLLHSFYDYWRDSFIYFDTYEYWEEILLSLGKPIIRSWPLRDQAYCYNKLINLFNKKEYKNRKYSPYRPHETKSRWCKEYIQKDPEIIAARKEEIENKRLWREHIGKTHHTRHKKRWEYDKPRRYYKKLRSRTYRRWEKKNIQNENFDVFSSTQKDREMFYDWKIWGY